MRTRWREWAIPVIAVLALGVGVGPTELQGQDEDEEESAPAVDARLLSGMALRGIGPALMSGRVSDIAIHPDHQSTWYVAVASGGVWKTTNGGVTWAPIFDSYGSYSIGTVAIDPNDPNVVWVGTGENNSQRSVAYGDGLYKSVDAGTTFRKVGLENSEHIAKIVIDPRDSDQVWVASQGPLWNAGGDRGVYRTRDGGESWELVLEVSENTGATDLVYDPRDPDVLYAATYQRRRHVWTLLNGGPESGIWKSEDGGDSWREINRGLPSGDLGRIGLAISPQRPDVLYAIVEAPNGQSGTFRTTNAGESWQRTSNRTQGTGQYYSELVADPHQFDRIYSLSTVSGVSDDGGRSWRIRGEQDKHIDNHALWIDPDDQDHHINGNDGGVYETFDGGQTWRFIPNLPITQFYKVAVSDDEPFYWVYGGTQDNATQGGPSRTRTIHGIRNQDWYVTTFGDGFEPAIEPGNPDIVYSQAQYGNLVRTDRRTGEQLDIQPAEDPDGPPLRWNWDSALMISPHSPTRLFFGAQILFQSDDRGNSWRPISGDLTRNMDRNRLEIMGRVWSVDAVAKNASTSFYGTIVAVTESPLEEGVIYVGTDDGLVQATEDGGASWRRIEGFPGVPEMTYVNDVEADLFDPNTVYAAFNNHKMGDFRPYVLKSTDRGRSWTSITGDLPERGSVYSIKQDHVNPDILFAGTEFGVWVTLNGGESWHELSAGIPTIAIRDVEIQRRENDLVLASFGRGFYILDDYTPLRQLAEQESEILGSDAHLFPVKTALAYIESNPIMPGDRGFQGSDYFLAPNPPFGAVFTVWMGETLRTLEQERRSEERAAAGRGEDVFYPDWDELKAEDREEGPGAWAVIRDEEGAVVRRVPVPTRRGLHRISWNLRYPGFTPVSANSDGFGPLATPGNYTVEIVQRHRSETRVLTDRIPFEVQALGMHTLPEPDREAVLAFQQETGALQRAIMGTNQALSDAEEALDMIREAAQRMPQVELDLLDEVRALELRLTDLVEAMQGDPTRPTRNEPGMPGVNSRLQRVVFGHWGTMSAPTETHRRSFEIARAQFLEVLPQVRDLIEVDLRALQQRLEEAGVPWTPGRGVPSYGGG